MKNLVFIVEDNLTQQKMLQLHFEKILGEYEVRAFSHPDQMLEHLDEKPFAVVLDHFYDDSKTGLDYLKIIRKKYSKLPVIYHTSLQDEAVKKQVKALGVEDFIVKDSASLVRLRTALDLLHEKNAKKGFFKKLFSRS